MPFLPPEDTIIKSMMPDAKLRELYRILKGMKSVLVAFSGGADSAFLLKAARDVCGKNVLAVTAANGFLPAAECRSAQRFARKLNVRHVLLKIRPGPRVRANPPDRCYYCKKDMFLRLLRIARRAKISFVLDGSHADDAVDFRPGKKALRELKIRSPLQEAGLCKTDIRRLARRMGLSTWNKPGFTCLATRVPFGEKVTPQKIRMIEQAESYILKFGVSQARLRHHGCVARIEVPEKDLPLLVRNRRKITRKLRETGFLYIAADLNGYRRGALNEAVQWKRKK